MKFALKKFFLAVLSMILIVALLGGCSAQDTPAPETAPPTTEVASAATQPVPTEARTIAQLDFPSGTIWDGLYTLDTSQYDFTFDDVLLDIDLTAMTFQLRCFDGNVVRGNLRAEEDLLICTHEGGRMMFYIDGDGHLVSTRRGPENQYIVSDQLMLCPQTQSSFEYRFLYAEDLSKEILGESEQPHLDDYKHLFRARYAFHTVVENQGERTGCNLDINYYPMQEKWTFTKSSRPEAVSYAENPDGTVTFSLNGNQWNFHWEGENLIFDGGSSLLADNGVDPTETYYVKTEVPVGAVFYAQNADYVYDALYTLPGNTLEDAYAGIQLDTKNQYIRIQCADGTVLRGPYTFIDDIHLYCNFEVPDYVGTRTAYVTLWPSGHALGVSNGWMMQIGPGSMGDTFYFTPVQGVQPPESTE